MACASCGSKYPPVTKRKFNDPVITYVRSSPKPQAVRGVIKTNQQNQPNNTSGGEAPKQPTE